MSRSLPIVTCPRCGQRRKARIPRGGDGSALLVLPHKTQPKGERCTGSDELVGWS